MCGSNSVAARSVYHTVSLLCVGNQRAVCTFCTKASAIRSGRIRIRCDLHSSNRSECSCLVNDLANAGKCEAIVAHCNIHMPHTDATLR